jgi:hypothetical protein
MIGSGSPAKLHIAGLWRYPVKSMAGEPLREAWIGPHGIPGDRVVWVYGPEGVRTSRRQYRLLGLSATLDRRGRPLVDGHSWESGEARRETTPGWRNRAKRAGSTSFRCSSRPTARSPRSDATSGACARTS